MKKFSFIMVLAGLLMACSSQYPSAGEKEYLKSRNGVNLVVPAPLTGENISHFYDLPSQNENAEVSITPPDETFAVSKKEKQAS